MNSPAAITPTVNVEAGMTILIPSGPVGDHLFVTVFDVQVNNGKQQVLLASIETQFSKCDKSCEMNVGDHAFVKHPSFVGYNHCRIEDLSHVISCINSGVWKNNYPPVSPAVLQKIQDGYISTKRVPRFVRADWGK